MKKYLIITTALTTICFAPEIMAQCTENTDCASLGYTETSCPDGGLKCPLGNYWYCPAEQCSPDYQYTCTGTGYTGGSGEACDGKYTSCTCADGYEWKDGTCQEILKPEWGKCNGSAKNCNIGDIVYSDGTCSSQRISGKTPIAVVVYKSDDGKCAQAMALKSIGTYEWDSNGYGTDISGLSNYSFASDAAQDLASCKNTAIITAEGTNGSCPAAWESYVYTTEGTNVGDWCLPAAGIFNSIKNNLSTINAGIISVNGEQLYVNDNIWSSSEYDNYTAWFLRFSYSYGLWYQAKSEWHDVRPVLEF